MGASDFFYRFKGGGGRFVEKHCTRASLHSDTVDNNNNNTFYL